MLIKKIRQQALSSRLRFNLYALGVTILGCFVLAFTPLTLKGAYFWQFLATITTANIIYSGFVKRGIAPGKV